MKGTVKLFLDFFKEAGYKKTRIYIKTRHVFSRNRKSSVIDSPLEWVPGFPHGVHSVLRMGYPVSGMGFLGLPSFPKVEQLYLLILAR